MCGNKRIPKEIKDNDEETQDGEDDLGKECICVKANLYLKSAVVARTYDQGSGEVIIPAGTCSDFVEDRSGESTKFNCSDKLRKRLCKRHPGIFPLRLNKAPVSEEEVTEELRRSQKYLRWMSVKPITELPVVVKSEPTFLQSDINDISTSKDHILCTTTYFSLCVLELLDSPYLIGAIYITTMLRVFRDSNNFTVISPWEVVTPAIMSVRLASEGPIFYFTAFSLSVYSLLHLMFWFGLRLKPIPFLIGSQFVCLYIICHFLIRAALIPVLVIREVKVLGLLVGSSLLGVTLLSELRMCLMYLYGVALKRVRDPDLAMRALLVLVEDQHAVLRSVLVAFCNKAKSISIPRGRYG
jgi:hypothetical protein